MVREPGPQPSAAARSAEPPRGTRPWWQSAVIYQIYPRSFQDSNGDGVGDLEGIRGRLGYLVDLGVDAIWISPFYPSPMADFGYDVADYTDVDPMFGTLPDFDRLLSDAHDRGLRVIIDWVPNHTSSQHPWFLDSRASRSSARRDWYVWRDPGADGEPPNNWRSVFGGPAWTMDETTGQYYLHSFLAAQPDLNWRNPEVVDAMQATLRFWLDRGVDGFRIDVAARIMKDPDLRDNPPASGEPAPFKNLGEADELEEVHSIAHPDVHTRFAELRELVDEYPGDRVLIGEIHDWDWESWATYYGTDRPELHLPFNFSMLYAPWDAEHFRSLITAVERVVPDHSWPNYVLGNHDEPRLVQRFGYRAAHVAAVLLLTLRGTPTLYYGDEIGMVEAHVPIEFQQDPWGKRVNGLGRDGSRTPMQWSTGPGAGFTSGRPWLPIVDPDGLHNVDSQHGDERSLLTLYRRLLDLRRSERALSDGAIELLESPPGVLVYRRVADGVQSFTIALNFGPGTASLQLAGDLEIVTGDIGSRRPDGLSLGANAAVVVRDPA